MNYAFADFVIDTDCRELRRGDIALHVQPQVFDLLLLLVQNAHRVVSRDEVIEKIWIGRIVSEDAISSRIRDLRRALNDTGKDRAFIRTIRGHGVRFIGDVTIKGEAIPTEPHVDLQKPTPGNTRGEQPSIAVLPFQRIGDPETLLAVEDAIPRELISTLASLRWIKVTSYGSAYRFRGQNLDLSNVGQVLNARYCLTGVIELAGSKIIVDTELADTGTSQVIWAMRKTAPLDDVHALRAEIAANVIGVTELEIPRHEAGALDYLAAENLDAWSAMHVAFQHLHQFSHTGNQIAERMLMLALEKEPHLARAQSGMAFVHFQNAFMRYEDDAAAHAVKAKEWAERSLMVQPQDPFGNFMMGRCHWLDGDPQGSKPWFGRAVEASPNYTWGHYGISWASIFTDDFDKAMHHAETAIELSPIDPFRPGMTGTKMWVNIAREDYAEAVKWSEIAARTPWAHAGMALFAAMSHWLNGDNSRAADWMNEVRRRDPSFTHAKLMALVPATNKRFTELLSKASKALVL